MTATEHAFNRSGPKIKRHPLAPLDVRIKKDNKIAKSLDSVIEGVFEVFSEEAIKFEPRASSLPFCPMLDLTQALRGEKYIKDYPFSFYTRAGNAMHETLQTAFPYSKHGKAVFGNWKCENPANDNKKPCTYIKNFSLRPKSMACPKCNSPLKYDELELSWVHKKSKRAAISGHCDLITKFKNKIILWEFKSSAQYNIDYPHHYLPYSKHLFQIWAYACMLDTMGMRPHYIALGYFSRNKAGESSTNNSMGVKKQNNKGNYKVVYYKVTDEAIKLMREVLDETVENVRLARNIEAAVLKGKRAKIAHLNKLGKNRPCKTKADYDTYMAHSYMFGEKCPSAKYVKDGGCFEAKNKVKKIKLWADLKKIAYTKLKQAA